MSTKVRSILVAAAAASMLIPSLASADRHSEVQTMLLRNGNDAGEYRRGNDGRERPLQQVGAGGEQHALVQLSNNDVLVFGMGSYRLNGQLPRNTHQMFCANIKMDSMLGPQMQGMAYVTDNNGDRDRTAMHIRATKIFNGDAVLITYNQANPGNRARAYQTVFGADCQQLSEKTLVMAKNNDDCSETTDHNPEIVTYQDANTARLISMHGCNGNGRDDMWIAGTQVTRNGNAFNIEKQWDFSAEPNEERTRPMIMATNVPDMALACWTAGNTQPPNKGVRCAGIDTAANTPTEDRLLWRQYVERKEGELYRTQIRADNVLDAAGQPTDMAFIQYQEVVKQRRRAKGQAAMKTNVVRVSRQGLDVQAVPTLDAFPNGDVTHGVVCSTMWGTEDNLKAGALMISSSVNGSTTSLASAQLITWDGTERQISSERRISLNAAIDNAWISNIYGNNPTTQGRNYFPCKSGVANPGYGVPGGYMEDVKEFVAVAAGTRRWDDQMNMPEEKLATEFILIPSVLAASASSDPTQAGTPAPATEITDPTDPSPDQPAVGTDEAAGCSVSGNSQSSGGFLALIGLALLIARRRRNS